MNSSVLSFESELTMRKISQQLLDKFLAGNCTPQEREEVDRWFSQFDSGQDDPRMLDVNERFTLDAKMLQKIRSKINQPADRSVKEKSGVRFIYRAAAGIAASLILVALMIFLADDGRRVAGLNETLTSVSNSTENIIRHELNDGTLIWLHPESRITFPNQFASDKRNLELAGEAFFDVAPDSLKPFVITTGNVTTRVLGTSFNIKAYDNQSSIEVAVLTGKVSVDVMDEKAEDGSKSTQSIKNSVLLTPNQRVTYLKEINKLQKEEPKDLPELSMWHAVDVVFDNVALKAVIPTLNKKFGVEIQVSNPDLLNCLIRADFTNQNLPDILELLSKSVDASYVIKNRTIRLTGDGCSI